MDAVERVEAALEHFAGISDPIVAADDLRTLLALARSNSWQDIETAPKDGTVVLLRYADDALVGYGPSRRAVKRVAVGCFEGWWIAGVPNGHSSGGGDDQFTHWAPIPEPPALDRLPSPPDTGE